MEQLRHHANGRDLTVREIEQVLQGRGIAILILVLDLPFALPVPNPLSTVFGLLILVLGLHLIFHKRSWLPRFLLEKRVPHPLLERMAEWGVKLSRRLEGIIRPRLHFVHSWRAMKIATGAGILLAACVLSLPLLVPNMLPAIAILCLTIGMIEEDGLLILVGHLISILSCAYVAGLLVLGRIGWQEIAGRFLS